jgi:error-prone DNA polymerase
MREVEVKLRHGMERNGITGKTQDTIVQSITSFALYGFPESHAASFALIAYASAYLKCHYLAAFTAALLNNQPMGFYQPATIVKDAQRHGLKIKPIDVTRSDWLCTVEEDEVGNKCLRLGMLYVKGLREEAARAIVRERTRAPFDSIDDLRQRVPELRKDEMRKLAEVGALNFISVEAQPSHRRDSLWQVERAVRPTGPLLDSQPDRNADSPLKPMSVEERLIADFRTTGLTIGRHPVAYRRAELDKLGIKRAIELEHLRNGSWVEVAGWVIVRQRPGTAKGFLFLSLEDESGIANIIVTPDLFESSRMVLIDYPFLRIGGVLQNQDNVVSIRAKLIQPLSFNMLAGAASHDFH